MRRLIFQRQGASVLGSLLLAAMACISASVGAQVLRCVAADGKVTYGDGAGCATSAKPVERVLGREATEQRDEPEGYRRQLQMESIQRARRIRQDTVEGVAQQSQGSGGAGIMEQEPASQSTDRAKVSLATSTSCDTYSPRKGCIGGGRAENPNWSARRGYHGGGGPTDRQYELEAELARRAATTAATQRPSMLTNCNASGCWDSSGNRYDRVGDGTKFIGPGGGMCRQVGQRVIC